MLTTYEEIITRCAKNEENFVIRNSDPEHASSLIKTFFEVGKAEVCIFTGQLFSGVYGNQNLLEKAKNFLNNDASRKIKIVFQDASAKDTIMNEPFLKTLLSKVDRKEQINLSLANKNLGAIKNHFIIMDKKAYRYELDKDTMEAIANFGDKEKAQELSLIFDMISKTSEKINLASSN